MVRGLTPSPTVTKTGLLQGKSSRGLGRPAHGYRRRFVSSVYQTSQRFSGGRTISDPVLQLNAF